MRKNKNRKRNTILIPLIVTVVYLLISYYFVHPAIDLHNPGLYAFILPAVTIFIVLYLIFGVENFFHDLSTGKRIEMNPGRYKILLIIPAYIIVMILLVIINSPMFNSKKYYERIKIDTDREFYEDIKEVDFNKLPLLDRDSSEKLGDRVMGEMSELVSQFDVSNAYTQINYKDEIIRVTPLEYNGFIKWITNREDGIKGYITVDSTDGKAKLTKLDKGMKYAPSAHFNENLYRKLQFAYPTYNFDSINFEIDNEGNPYWIASVIKYHGLGQRREVTGIVILNPIDGSSKYYKTEDVPKWVDHVYEADLIIEQVDDWGAYKNGFLNSIFTQKDVVETTRGYNYLAMDDDIYLYTGITSVLTDESNIGFILTNMRTKETRYYNVSGAEEYSAMDSAKGQVQQMNYSSTFPLLINLNNRPTYLISLKDNAGLVKMYAFVDVVNYQKVVVTDATKGIEKAAENYLKEAGNETVSKEEKEVIINNLKTVIIDGNTNYYFDDNNQKYKVSITINKDLLPFINNGDKVKIKYNKVREVIEITEIERGE